MQRARGRLDAEATAFLLGKCRKPTVSDHDAFGDAGGTGGVDDIGRVVQGRRSQQLRGIYPLITDLFEGCECLCLIEQNGVCLVGDDTHMLGGGENDARSRVVDHVVHAVDGIRRVDGYECSAGPGNRPDRDHGFQ